MPLWLLLTLIASIFWAISQVFIKKGLENVSALWSNIISNVVKLLIWMPSVLVLSHFSIKPISFLNLLLIILSGSFYLTMFYALSKGKLALTGTVVAMYPALTLIWANIFLKERVTALQLTGILIILLGALILAWPKQLNRKVLEDMHWLWWGLISACLIGTADFFTKVSTNLIGAHSNIFYLSIVLQFLSVGNFLLDKKGRLPPIVSFKTLMPTLIGTIILWTGSLLFFLAFDYGPASLIVPVSSTYPALMVILSMIFLKERITKQQVLGIVSSLAGIALLSFS